MYVCKYKTIKYIYIYCLVPTLARDLWELVYNFKYTHKKVLFYGTKVPMWSR